METARQATKVLQWTQPPCPPPPPTPLDCCEPCRRRRGRDAKGQTQHQCGGAAAPLSPVGHAFPPWLGTRDVSIAFLKLQTSVYRKYQPAHLLSFYAPPPPEKKHQPPLHASFLCSLGRRHEGSFISPSSLDATTLARFMKDFVDRDNENSALLHLVHPEKLQDNGAAIPTGELSSTALWILEQVGLARPGAAPSLPLLLHGRQWLGIGWAPWGGGGLPPLPMHPWGGGEGGGEGAMGRAPPPCAKREMAHKSCKCPCATKAMRSCSLTPSAGFNGICNRQ